MPMRYIITCVFSLLVSLSSPAQNMVFNSGFDQTSLCPYGGALFNAIGWSSPTYGTTDLFNSCVPSGSYGVPVNLNAMGYQQAHSGNGYAGVVGYYLWGGDIATEYLEGHLNYLLVPGQAYEVTIHVALANPSKYATGGMGVFFYKNGVPVNTGTILSLILTPQIDYISYGVVSDTMNWTTLIDTFVADSAYERLIVGNFRSLGNIPVATVNTSTANSTAYYLIDDVSVKSIIPMPFTTVLSQTNIHCNGPVTGSATITPTGGTAPYTYLWSNGQTTQTITGLAAGTYTCAVTDAANQTITQIVIITETPAISATLLSTTNVGCNGGSNGAMSILVSGGQPSYTYQWSSGGTGTSISGVPAGTYTFTVTDLNNCAATVTATITQPPVLTASITSTNVSCFGQTNGSATAVPSGGTPPYTYLWNNSQTTQTITGLAPGNYNVVIIDNEYCTSNASVVISQPPLLTVSFTSTNVHCFGQPSGTATVFPSGGTTPYSYQWSNGQTTQIATGLTAGSYTVTVTDSKNCTVTGIVNILQFAQFNLTTVNITPTSCTQNTGTATTAISGGTSFYTYSWLPYGGNSSSASGLGAGTYIVTATDNFGCTDTVHITIPSATPPIVTISNVGHMNCYGQSTGSATATASNGVAPYTYLWSNGQTTATATGLAAGTYTVTATGSNGCSGSATVTITQPTQLNANITSFINVNCFGQSNGSATSTVTGGTPPYTYQWLPTGGVNATASSLSSGTYTVNVTDSKGCTDNATVTILQPTALNATIASANATCSQSNGWATVTPTGGTAPYTYLWSNGQTGTNINSLGAGSYSVTVTDAHGCTKLANVTITQSVALTINIAATSITCNGLNNGTASASAQTGTPPYTYQWSNGQTTQTISSLSAGTYTVTVSDLAHCVGTATVTIANPPLLTSTISASTDVLCHGQSTGEAIVTVTGGISPYTYLWSNNSTSSTASNLSAGIYTVTVTDINGCTSTNTVTINEPTELTLTTQSSTNSCKNKTDGSATIAVSGGVAPYTCLWDNGQTSSSATNLAPGSYYVTVTDANSCTKTIQVTIGEYPTPNVDAGADKDYCAGKEPVTLHGSGADTYQWSPTTGLSCATCATTEAAPENTTVYILAGIDANGCTATDEVVVTVITKQPTAVGKDIHICGAQTIQLEALGGNAYSWSPAEGMNDSYIASPTVTVQSSTAYTVIIKQGECFIDTLTQSVTVYTMPAVSVGPDINADLREQVQLTADTLNASAIEWIPPVNLNCADCYNPVANAERDIRYVARVSNEGGCVAEDDIVIRVACTEGNVWLPSSFTPNNDGKNEYFYPRGVPQQAVEYMAVYNRWGQKIFERKHFTANIQADGWDGTFKDRLADVGVYHYYVKFTCSSGKNMSLTGDITLLR